MSTPFAQRYLVINKLDSPFNTDFLIFPSWEGCGGDTVCIIDLKTGCYMRQSEWPDESLGPVWVEMEEDTL
jgi:hypothetical protein